MMDNTFCKKGMSTISAADRQAAGSVQEGWLNCKTENIKKHRISGPVLYAAMYRQRKQGGLLFRPSGRSGCDRELSLQCAHIHGERITAHKRNHGSMVKSDFGEFTLCQRIIKC